MKEVDPAAAVKFFDQGGNCAEAVLAGVRCPLAATGVATALGGGIARLGHTCGCLTGAALALGVLAGRRAPGDEALKARVYDRTQDFFQRFEARFGSTECRALTGVDFRDPADRERYDAAAKDRCRAMVAWVVAELA